MMTRNLFRIGTLILLLTTALASDVPERYRDERRGEPRSEVRDQRPISDRTRNRRSTAIHRPNYCYFCERTPSGRIRRSSSARRAFKELHPCPSTRKSTGPCPGYVIDHVIPLGRGGEDQPGNMQWQTREDAKAKDRME